jgi:hypothetical protein
MFDAVDSRGDIRVIDEWSGATSAKASALTLHMSRLARIPA